MKSRFVPLLAAGLVAVGAFGDHVLTRTSTPAQPAALQSPAGAHSGVSTTSYSTAPIRSSSAVSSASIDQATEHAYAIASPSVVYVNNVGTGTGSGIIFNAGGDIVTNDHVVTGGGKLTVTLSSGQVYPAQLVGADPADDLAVISIHASGLTPATFAKAGGYQVAQTVLAIGSPLGLKQSVTSGLISGLGRVEQEPNGAYLPNAIQTSAAINPGNSGGALVTLDGVVVGMPTLEQTSTQGGESTQAIGFAVPSSRITDLASQIIATGKVQHTGRAYLGVAPTDPSAQTSSPFGGGFGPGGGNSATVQGAVVAQVAANGPAGHAGVQQGDTITSVNGARVSDAQGLLTILAQKQPDQSVTLGINRNGRTLTISVHLSELPA